MNYSNWSGSFLALFCFLHLNSYFTTSALKLNLELFKHANKTVTCPRPFEGFGVFMGSVRHFQMASKGAVQAVFQQIYDDLGIRHFRTSYESEFSPVLHNYTISCATGNFSCTWIEIMDTVSQFPDISIFASLWSPPHYMKNEKLITLSEESEWDYYYFVKNITEIIKTRWGIQIERVSVNEPENLVASWEHTNMSPEQMCSMIKKFNDPLLKICPENSNYMTSKLYSNYKDPISGVGCKNLCDVYATHAYALKINVLSPKDSFSYYDAARHSRFTPKPIWMTEVCSTGESENPHIQIKEALDLASNIVHYVGDICVERYYFWYAFTHGSSGESLIWGYNPSKKELILPKKYYSYRHFTLAALAGNETVAECKIVVNSEGNEEQLCLTFAKNGTFSAVFVNKAQSNYQLHGIKCLEMCCTTSKSNWFCTELNEQTILPKRSICSCVLDGHLPDARTRKGHYKIKANIISHANGFL